MPSVKSGRKNWNQIFMKSVLNMPLIFNVQFIFTGKIISTLLHMAFKRRRKKHLGVKLTRDCADAIFMKGDIDMSKIDEYIARRS